MLPERLARDPRFSKDPRLSPVRDGLNVDPSKFTRMQVVQGSCALRREPDGAGEQINQALFGEGFQVFTEIEGWAWGLTEADHYAGWVRAAALGPRIEPTHRVAVLRTFIFERPNMKSTPIRPVSMNAQLTLGETDGGYARVIANKGERRGGWLFSRHAAPATEFETDFVDVASRFVGSPYLWGGRQSAGLDCSGLVQVSLQATGVSPLRDSDMQEQTLGEPIEPAADYSNLKRGDLVFWKGHVGIMESPTMLLHASARDLHVEVEPLAEAVARIRPIAGEVRSVRRL